MTGAVLIAIYLVALATFLGLDIIAKVPPTLHAVMVGGLGALAGVALIGGLRLATGAGAASGSSAGTPVLALVAIALGAAAAVGGTLAVARGLHRHGGRKKGA